MATLGDAPNNGVYTLGNYAKNYPMVLDLTYPISERDSEELVLNNIEIGSVLAAGNDIFVAWYNHNAGTFGVDKVDYDNKLDKAFFETMIQSILRDVNTNFTNFVIAYASKPDGTDIELYYSNDYGVTFLPLDGVDDVDRNLILANKTVDTTVLMEKVVARAVDNDSPSIESGGITVI